MLAVTEGIETARRILCVFPSYTSSFGTFEYAYPLTQTLAATGRAIPAVLINECERLSS